MPTYEYRCPSGHEFERFYRSISVAHGEVACPTCGVVAERRMSAGAGLLFKGSGFYITDYGKDGKKDQRAAAKADTSDKSDKSEKPATSEKLESPATLEKPGKSEKSPANAGAPAAGDRASAAKPAPESKPAGDARPAAAPKSTGSSE